MANIKSITNAMIALIHAINAQLQVLAQHVWLILTAINTYIMKLMLTAIKLVKMVHIELESPALLVILVVRHVQD
jgi:hypothetical protein